MFCVLNDTHPKAKGYTSDNLVFEIDYHTINSTHLVHKINDTAISLNIDKTTVSPNNHYVVNCRLDDGNRICTRYVYVGCKLFWNI